MRLNRRRFLSITAAATALGTVGHTRGAPASWRGRALGAEAEVTLYGMEGEVLRDIPNLLADIEKLFSLHDDTSTLARLNTAKTVHHAPQDFTELITLCHEMHGVTSGHFDPTVQPLWLALAAGTDTHAARAAIGMHRVHSRAASVSIGGDQALTLNGIAQGYATDRVTEHLRAAGAAQVLINIGEFRSLGGPFRLGLSDPVLGLHGWRSLTGAALATSSPAAMNIGPEQSHILDPFGLSPARWSSVTVEAATAAVADALSTAMCHMTVDEIDATLARRPDVARAILVSHAGEVAQKQA